MTTPPRTVTEARDALADALVRTDDPLSFKGYDDWADRFLAALPDGWTLARTDLAARVGALEGALRDVMDWHDATDAAGWGPCNDPECVFNIARALLSEPTPEAVVEPYDEADDMCPNCQTPWKCNGPHFAEFTPRAKRAAAPAPVERCAFVWDTDEGYFLLHPFIPEVNHE